jgi:hypothetical protein
MNTRKTAPENGKLGKFGVTAQLFGIIDEMRAEKQFLLLQQVLGGRLPAHLMSLVLDMTEARKLELLRALTDSHPEEAPVTTISLDDSDHLMRGMLRKPCRLPVRFHIDGELRRSLVVDISMEGVFIESAARPTAGSTIQMILALPGSATPLTLKGVVAHKAQGGFGVAFRGLTDVQHAEIAKFIGSG